MRSSVRFALAAAVLTLAGQAQANTLITFEEPALTAMANIPGSSVPLAAQLSTQFLSTLGVSFSSGAGYVAVVYHDATYTPSTPNVIGGTSLGGTLDYGAPINAAFFIGTTTAATTNYVRVLGDLIPLGSGTVTLSAFDLLGNLLGSVSDNDNYPLGQGPVLALSIAGIHSVSFSGTSQTVAFDNFEFGDLSAPSDGAVPEPSSWALMILGLGGTGAMLRRRRQARMAIRAMGSSQG